MLCQDILKAVEKFARHIESARATRHSTALKEVECVVFVRPRESDKIPECYYYMINHSKRLIFWMNEFDAGKYLLHVDGVTEAAHLSKDCFFLGPSVRFVDLTWIRDCSRTPVLVKRSYQPKVSEGYVSNI